MMDQIKIYKSSPDNKDSPKAQDPTTVVTYNKMAPTLEGGNSTKIGGMWIHKYDKLQMNPTGKIITRNKE